MPNDIYNLYASFKRERLHGLSVTDALIGYLEEKGIHYTIRPDNDNQTRYLFIVHPRSLELAYANPDVMIADCTYQTNKFNLPLLHLIGMWFHITKFQFHSLSDIFRKLPRTLHIFLE